MACIRENFIQGHLKETDHLGNLGIEGLTVFIWIFNRINGTEWIYLAQEFMTSKILNVKTLQKATRAFQLTRINKEFSFLKCTTLTYIVIHQQPVKLGTHINPKVLLSSSQTSLCMLVCVQALAWY